MLAAVLSLAMFAGCVEKPAATTSSKAPESKKEEVKSEEPAKKEPVELTYWSMWSAEEAQGKAIQEAITAYEAESGNKVKVEWKGRDIKTIIQATLDAKTEIDIFDDDYMQIGTKYKDNLYDLEEMAKKADYESYAVAALPKAIRTWAGSLKAIPYQPYTSGIFYDKAAFKKAGIAAEPKTWTELLDACEKLKAAGYVPLAQDDAYVSYSLGFQMARYLGQQGVVDVVKKGDWAENPMVLKAVEDIVTLKKKGYLSKTCPDTFPEGENEIGLGKAAMIVNASWVPQEITNNTQCNIEWGMFNYPTVEGGKDPATIANVGAQAFAIPSYSKHPQEAFDLIMKITSGEFDQKMALTSQGIPADTRNTEWPPLIAGCKDAFNALTDVYDWNMGLGTDDDIYKVVNDCALKLFEGKLDAKGFVAEMEKAGVPKVK